MKITANTVGFWAAAVVGTILGFCVAGLVGIQGKDWIGFSGTVLGAGIGAAFAVAGAWWVAQLQIREGRQGYALQLLYDIAPLVNQIAGLIVHCQQGNAPANIMQQNLLREIRISRQGPAAMLPRSQIPLFLAEQAVVRSGQATPASAIGELEQARNELIKAMESLRPYL